MKDHGMLVLLLHGELQGLLLLSPSSQLPVAAGVGKSREDARRYLETQGA